MGRILCPEHEPRVYFAAVGEVTDPTRAVLRWPLTGTVKIGHSVSTASRIGQVRSEIARAVTMITSASGVRAMESMLHDAFAAERVMGEYFRRSPRLDAYISRVAATGSLAPLPSIDADIHPMRRWRYARAMNGVEFARLVGCKAGMVSQWECGRVRPSIVYALAIESATAGDVRIEAFGYPSAARENPRRFDRLHMLSRRHRHSPFAAGSR